MEHREGWKLVYSGDTRPCPALIKAGAGATVLVHEATFPDHMLRDARIKRHSTTGEAITIGLRMGADFTVSPPLAAPASCNASNPGPGPDPL